MFLCIKLFSYLLWMTVVSSLQSKRSNIILAASVILRNIASVYVYARFAASNNARSENNVATFILKMRKLLSSKVDKHLNNARSEYNVASSR